MFDAFFRCAGVASILFAGYVFIIRKCYRVSKEIYRVALFSIGLKFFNAFFFQKLIYGSFYASGDVYDYEAAGRAFLVSVKTNPVAFLTALLTNFFMPASERVGRITGFIYYVTGGASFEIPAIVTSFVSSVGAYFFFEAFRLAFPKADCKIFGYLIFLCPSILFWTSMNLKEPWIFFFLGLATFGASALFRGQFIRGAVWMLAGCYFGFYIKPNAIAPFFGALLFLIPGLAWSGKIWKGTALAMITVFLIQAALFLYQRYVGGVDLFLGMKKLTGRFIQGGSAIAIVPVASIADMARIPENMIAVLFRPFLLEAHNVLAFFSGLENLFLLMMVLFIFKEAIACRGEKNAFYLFCAVYVFVFVGICSFVAGNLGTIVRYRMPALPFLFMLAASSTKNRNHQIPTSK